MYNEVVLFNPEASDEELQDELFKFIQSGDDIVKLCMRMTPKPTANHISRLLTILSERVIVPSNQLGFVPKKEK
jgi:hypothetical protein